MKSLKYILLSTILLGLSKNVYATENISNLSLDQCIKYALENNLDIKSEKFNLNIQSLAPQKIRDEFGFSFGLNPSIKNELRPTSNSFISGASVLAQFSQDYNLSLSKKFEEGGELSLRFENNIFSTNSNRVDFNPAITPSLSASFSQPILKNAFNGKRRLEISNNTYESSFYSLKNRINEIIYNTQTAYRDYKASKLKLKVAEDSLNFSKEVLSMNQEKFKLGNNTKFDVLNSEIAVLNQTNNLIQAQRQAKNSFEKLKVVLNIKDTFDIADQVNFEKRDLSFEKSLEKAYQKPDLKIIETEIKSNELQKSINEQNRLPSLNFTGSTGTQALSKDYLTSLSSLLSFKTYFWNVGLSFEFPVWGNLNETQYQESLLKLERSVLNLENSKQKLKTELINIFKDIETSEQRIELTKKAKELSKQLLDGEKERLKFGYSNTFQLLQYQKDYQETELNYINALIDYMKALDNLSFIQGTSDIDNNIVLSEK